MPVTEREIEMNIDYRKFEEDDALWDGLKGYITNTKLPNDMVLKNYGNLFEIEQFSNVQNGFAYTPHMANIQITNTT
jgi:hypothetical protein